MYVYYLHIFGYNLHIHIDTSIYNCIILYIYIYPYTYRDHQRLGGRGAPPDAGVNKKRLEQIEQTMIIHWILRF